MRRVFEYDMMEPIAEDELPDGVVAYEIYKDQRGFFGIWGKVVYARPLAGWEIDRYNLDGPVAAWV